MDFLDRHYVTRRSVLALATWQTWDSYRWAKQYAEAHADKPAIETAAIIAAVLAAVTALQGFVLKLYNDGKDL